MIVLNYSNLNKETIDALNRLSSHEINANMAFKLMKILKEVDSHLDDKRKLESRTFEKWAKRDENNNILKVKDEFGNEIPDSVDITDHESFSKEMSALMNVDITINSEKISFQNLGLDKISVKDLMLLEFLFD